VNRHATLRLASAAGLAASLLLGCTVPRNGDGHSDSLPFVIDGIVIRNELAYPVTDVMIEVPATGAFAGCGNVLPRTACSNAFQGVDYRSSAVLVHWREHAAPSIRPASSLSKFRSACSRAIRPLSKW
jgi:hypothetical protein